MVKIIVKQVHTKGVRNFNSMHHLFISMQKYYYQGVMWKVMGYTKIDDELTSWKLTTPEQPIDTPV